MQRTFLIVGGCPRSGTSVLGYLLGRHPDVIMGIERYKNFAHKSRIADFRRELFEFDRFFDFRPTDTNVLPGVAHPAIDVHGSAYYEDMRKKFRNARVVGDKNPAYAIYMPQIADALVDIRFVMIVRHPHSVGLSWERLGKGREKFWSGKTYADGIMMWLAYHREILDQHRAGLPVNVVLFERLMAGDDSYLRTLLSVLGLEFPDTLAADYAMLAVAEGSHAPHDDTFHNALKSHGIADRRGEIQACLEEARAIAI